MDPEGKREAILAAGERLFAGQGYAGTTMAEIASAAGVAVGTLYRLFPDKRALLEALHIRMEDHFITSTLAGWAAGADGGARLDAMAEHLLADAQDRQAAMPLYMLTRDMVGSSAYQPGAKLIGVIRRLYQSGVNAGDFRRHDPATAAAIAHGMIEGGMRAALSTSSPARRARVLADLKVLFRRAFLAAPD
jgi:AcrR family transcriptional regulator